MTARSAGWILPTVKQKRRYLAVRQRIVPAAIAGLLAIPVEGHCHEAGAVGEQVGINIRCIEVRKIFPYQ